MFICNHLAWELYQKVSGQVIVAGMGDILGIRHEAIETILNIHGIVDPDLRVELFEKVCIIDGIRMKFRNQELTMKSQSSKNKK